MADIPTADDVKGYSAEEFAQLQAVMATEQERRWVLAEAVAQGTALAQAYQKFGGDVADALAQIQAAVTDPTAAS